MCRKKAKANPCDQDITWLDSKNSLEDTSIIAVFKSRELNQLEGIDTGPTNLEIEIHGNKIILP